MALQYCGHVIQTETRDQYTALPLVGVLAILGYRRFQICCVFAEYDLLKPTIFIQNIIYIDFRINLTQFYINFSRQEHQIELLWVSINS